MDPLFGQLSELLREDSAATPLRQMTTEERLIDDYAGIGLIGRHPMVYRSIAECKRR